MLMCPLNRSQLVVEKTPDALQAFHTLVHVEKVIPSATLKLQNMPGVICVGGVGRKVAFPKSEGLQIPLVDPEMQNGDMVID